MHGGVLVLVVLALVCGGSLITVGRRALGAHRGGGARKGPKKAGWLAHRREMRLERERHENAAAREDTRHEHKIAEQEHAAEKRAEAAASGRRGGNVFAKVVRLGDEPAEGPGAKPGARPPAPGGPGVPPPSSSPSGTPDPSPPSGTTRPPGSAAPGAPRPASAAPAAQPASPRQPPARGGTEPRPAPGTTPPQSPRGGTVTVMPFAEQVVDGINGIAAHVRAGNIIAKRRGMLALMHLCDRAATMALNLARALAEPGQHYGVEVTEPIARGAVHLNAASMAFAESDSALASLLQASLAETMAAGRQVPHHDELTETGAR